ncbi:hypothetical protein FK220_006005 [Flavobacteriaceae bacterium TP-CH-4]|uniref:Uncharacterized protein n=1 Tax=Pelagihabitans pacificus TaxID=2696054 RepID=A0A967ARM9_9FLAO|nr:hypothetical protein [Pelagihabitans pacificus]NHF58884.1 hypothetical protein [Pelagihabitans pacificus]
MKSVFTKLFLVLFVSMTAFSCVKSTLEDAAEELEKEFNEQEAKTELIVEE